MIEYRCDVCGDKINNMEDLYTLVIKHNVVGSARGDEYLKDKHLCLECYQQICEAYFNGDAK